MFLVPGHGNLYRLYALSVRIVLYMHCNNSRFKQLDEEYFVSIRASRCITLPQVTTPTRLTSVPGLFGLTIPTVRQTKLGLKVLIYCLRRLL